MISDQKVTELLQQIRHCMKLYQKIVHRELKKYKLTFLQIQVLRLLHQENSRSLRQLSEEIGSSMSSMSGVVDRLEKLELVTRKRDHKDRRIVWITLTTKCKELINDFPTNHTYFFRKYIGSMTVEEIDLLTGQLQLLTKNFEKGIQDEDIRQGRESS